MSGADFKKNIYTIPAGLSFADELARYVYDRTGGDPLELSQFTILLPSRRSCRTLREAFLRLSDGRPTVLPKLQPLGDIDADELTLGFAAESDAALEIPQAISPLRRQIILAKTVMSLHGGAMRFDQAAQLATELARFLDEIQTENLSFDGLDKLVPKDIAGHWQITLEFLKILTQNWPDILKDEAMIDPALRRNLLLNAQAELWRQRPPEYPVIAAGSTASIPATLDFLDVIAGLPQGMIVMPGLDRSLDEDSWQDIGADHPQYFLKKMLNHLHVTRTDVQALGSDLEGGFEKERLWSEVMRPADTTGKWRDLQTKSLSKNAIENLNLVTCKTQQDEAETIAVMMREALETSDKTIALVTANRNLARRVAGALKRWQINIDDSAGYTLHQSPSGAWALAVAAMVAHEFIPVDVLNTLKNPLLRLGLSRTEVEAATSEIEIHALRGIRPPNGLRGMIARFENPPELLTRLAAAVEGFVSEKQAFIDHAKAHIILLETLAETADESGAERLWRGDDGEALGLFFAELMQVGADLPMLDFDHYLLTIRQFMAQKTVRPKFGTHPRLSILGQLESRLYVADTVILGGLNEGQWPPESAADPWMSRQMRHDFGLPAREQVTGIAAHDFVQLASGARVILTRALREGDAPTVPSRWLLRLQTVLEATGLKLNQNIAQDYIAWKNGLDLPDVVRPILRPAPCPPVEVRPKGLSVTAVERLMRDPYEIYAKTVLKLKKLDDLDADPAAAERGQALHEILDKFTALYPDKLPDDAVERLLDIGRTVFTEINIPEETHSFWWPRFERMAARFVRNEKTWREGAQAEKTEVSGRLALKVNDIDFTLTAKADRIDRQKSGALAIIDYKSGSAPNSWEIKAGFSPQLWLEALIAARGGFEEIPPAEIGYLAHWIISGGTKNEFQKPVKYDDVAEMLTETEDGFSRVLQCFLESDTPYIARPNSNALPKYSDYTHFERVHEWLYDDRLEPEKVGT